jgi:hypothetical protein
MLRRLQWPATCHLATVRNGRSSLIAAPRTATAGPAATGREYALATGRFREAEFQWPLSGDQFEERIDATRPVADFGVVSVNVG